jgi:hypothetical protein
MKRSRFSRRTKVNSAAEELIHLANGVAQSASRIEDEFWEQRLTTAIDHLLADGDDATLNAALDQLYNAGGRAYDELADMVESSCQCKRLPAPTDQDIVMFAVPVLAWWPTCACTFKPTYLPARPRSVLAIFSGVLISCRRAIPRRRSYVTGWQRRRCIIGN